mmetsp:Transcript_9202/g.13435  ORF Transcript_9202/g.13435 Transcript_9202/m.13435 type:complete len:167 (-) Transcript_9202:1039-1539(-)
MSLPNLDSKRCVDHTAMVLDVAIVSRWRAFAILRSMHLSRSSFTTSQSSGINDVAQRHVLVVTVLLTRHALRLRLLLAAQQLSVISVQTLEETTSSGNNMPSIGASTHMHPIISYAVLVTEQFSFPFFKERTGTHMGSRWPDMLHEIHEADIQIRHFRRLGVVEVP